MPDAVSAVPSLDGADSLTYHRERNQPGILRVLHLPRREPSRRGRGRAGATMLRPSPARPGVREETGRGACSRYEFEQSSWGRATETWWPATSTAEPRSVCLNSGSLRAPGTAGWRRATPPLPPQPDKTHWAATPTGFRIGVGVCPWRDESVCFAAATVSVHRGTG